MLLFKVFTTKSPFAKILAFSAVAHKFRIIIDKELDPDINVYLNESTRIMFKKCSGGLYYYETTNMKHNTMNR